MPKRFLEQHEPSAGDSHLLPEADLEATLAAVDALVPSLPLQQSAERSSTEPEAIDYSLPPPRFRNYNEVDLDASAARAAAAIKASRTASSQQQQDETEQPDGYGTVADEWGRGSGRHRGITTSRLGLKIWDERWRC